MVVPTSICIVENDACLRNMLAELLVADGFQARAFAGATELLASGERQDHACFLIDLQLPGGGGVPLLETVSERWPQAAIVAIMDHGNPDMAIRAFRSGASDFVEKPVKTDELLEVLRRVIARAKRRSARAEPELAPGFATLTLRWPPFSGQCCGAAKLAC
ncbi:response regulator transcription factor [Tranquillimonas alkanivorans]|uniref:Response regulator receiver domain-containing protein n=1 Tax=Tranquillimonas alkanivorans TaxID=441119 RepID=A0A1I5X1P1_9RHOB|nr:response regulator [Tranquillimonas alkanivorans]SFQ25879.1 Response regulator receiver domain-containing protein [Tranquillimonas alkanivorans]